MIALGSNRGSLRGSPSQTMQWACDALRRAGLDITALSSLYLSAAMGPNRPEPYVNGVVLAHSHLPPHALLALLKRIERHAGPRSAMPWGPRSLDLDIVDYKGLVRNWRQYGHFGRPAKHGRLVYPHASAHQRPFVMVPLAEVAPGWRHPVLRRTSLDLMSRLRQQRAGRILERLRALR